MAAFGRRLGIGPRLFFKRTGGVSVRRRARVPDIKLGNSAKQLSSMPEKNTELLQVSIGKQAQSIEIDTVFGKDIGILFETECLKQASEISAQSYPLLSKTHCSSRGV